MKTIIIGILSFAIGIFIGLTFGKVLNWNAITAIATLIMSLCAILALFDWKKEQKMILYKDRRRALKQLNKIVLKLEDVYKRLMPSYAEIPNLLKEIESLKVHLEYDEDLKTNLKKYCDTYSNIYSFTTVIDRVNKEENISQENKKNVNNRLQRLIEGWIFKMPTNSECLKKIIQKKLEV